MYNGATMVGALCKNAFFYLNDIYLYAINANKISLQSL